MNAYQIERSWRTKRGCCILMKGRNDVAQAIVWHPGWLKTHCPDAVP
jgi:hypothetical protein